MYGTKIKNAQKEEFSEEDKQTLKELENPTAVIKTDVVLYSFHSLEDESFEKYFERIKEACEYYRKNSIKYNVYMYSKENFKNYIGIDSYMFVDDEDKEVKYKSRGTCFKFDCENLEDFKKKLSYIKNERRTIINDATFELYAEHIQQDNL